MTRLGPHRALALAALLATLDGGRARAEPFPALSDAGILPRGAFAVGLVSRSRVGIDEMIELDTQLGWWLLLSPHLELRLQHLASDRLRLTSSLALSTPTPAMRLLKGYLFPTWQRSENDVGWFVVPEVGLAASTGRRLVITGRTSVAVGVGVGPNAARSLDTYAPVELVFAPALNGFRVTTTAIADWGVLRWMRLRLEVSLHAIGEGEPPRSPWVFQTSAAADVRLGRHWRVSAGLAYYNSDQRAQRVVKGDDGRWRREPARSNDVHPTVDVVWVR